MKSKSLEVTDYDALQDGLADMHHAYAWCLGHAIPLAWPHEHRAWEYASAFQAIREHINRQIVSVLDVGSGNSLLGPGLNLRGIKVHEIDPSPNVYQEQRVKVVNASRPHIPFSASRASLLDDAAVPGTYDAVTSISVMEHIPPAEQAPAWGKLVEALAPWGLLVATIDYGDTAKGWKNSESRETRFGQPELEGTLDLLRSLGMRIDADLTYHGDQVFDYTFYRIVGVKGD